MIIDYILYSIIGVLIITTIARSKGAADIQLMYPMPDRQVHARKKYKCQWRCPDSIEKGALHMCQVHLESDGTSIFNIRFHLECAEAANEEFRRDYQNYNDVYCDERHKRGEMCDEELIPWPVGKYVGELSILKKFK